MHIVEYKGYTVIFASESAQSRLFDGKCALALGNFDGVHIAHRELLREVIEMKKRTGCELVGAWTFRANPLEYFVKDPPRAICSPQKKVEIMLSLGMDFVVLADFLFFKDMPHEDFCDYLREDMRAECVVCGYNFRFGRGGKGTPETLFLAFGEDNTFVVGEVDYGGAPVSSTRIRGLVESGEISAANTLLGRPFSVKAPVVSGKRLGRTLGFPTANQYFEEGSLVPRRGIYATRCNIGGADYIGVTNIGVRPTVDDEFDSHKVVNAETYLLDFSGDIYGESVEIEFIEYLRDEIKFSSLEELREAISRDAHRAKNIVKI